MRYARRARQLMLLTTAYLLCYFLPVLVQWLRWRLRPSASVLAVHDGELRHPTHDYAIVVLWQSGALPWYVLNLLNALAANRVNVVAVCNRDPGPEALQDLAALCATILLRDNSGFDIGGYRDGYHHIMAHGAPRRLLFANDSVYYYAKGLVPYVRQFFPPQGGADVIAAFENTEHHFHFQSFFLSVSERLLLAPEVQAFWRRYVPVSNRRWCINRGEVAFTRCLLQAGGSTQVASTGAALARALTEVDAAELLAERHFVSQLVRSEWRDLMSAFSDLLALTGHNQPRREQQSALALAVAGLCCRRNPIHGGGFFFNRYLGVPLVKRDLVYREQFTLTELESNLTAVGFTEHLDEVMSEVRRKGGGWLLGGMAWARYATGVA